MSYQRDERGVARLPRGTAGRAVSTGIVTVAHDYQEVTEMVSTIQRVMDVTVRSLVKWREESGKQRGNRINPKPLQQNEEADVQS
jgi:hypothetical protein